MTIWGPFNLAQISHQNQWNMLPCTPSTEKKSFGAWCTYSWMYLYYCVPFCTDCTYYAPIYVYWGAPVWTKPCSQIVNNLIQQSVLSGRYMSKYNSVMCVSDSCLTSTEMENLIIILNGILRILEEFALQFILKTISFKSRSWINSFK